MGISKRVVCIPQKALCEALLRIRHGLWRDESCDQRQDMPQIFCAPASRTLLSWRSETTRLSTQGPRTSTDT